MVVSSGCYGDSVLKVNSVSRFCMEVCLFSACLICPLSNLCAGRSPSTWSSTSPTGPVQSPPDVLAAAITSTSTGCPENPSPEPPAAPRLWEDPAQHRVTSCARRTGRGLHPRRALGPGPLHPLRELRSPRLNVSTPHLHTWIFNPS